MIFAQIVHEIYSCEAIGFGIFVHVLSFSNCQPEAVGDVISSTADQDVGMDACANFGDSRLKPPEASFSALVQTSITFDRKYIVTSYPVWS